MSLPAEVDVLIIGAGLSGIGTACHVKKKFPGKSMLILEARQSMGGTWDVFRFPGIRSDSDMHTLSYKFKPWSGSQDIVDGPQILDYIKEAAAEHELEQIVHYGCHVSCAAWSSKEAAWTVHVRNSEHSTTVRCKMLLSCAGYYKHQAGHCPEFPGQDVFTGRIVHPQTWPDDLDYRGAKVVVIGSGATAVTLVPAMSQKAESVTMLQRSPSYMVARPGVSPLSKKLRKYLPHRLAARLSRWWNLRLGLLFYHKSRSHPEQVKKLLLAGIRQQLGPQHDRVHFRPHYQPWDQRLCVVRDGDLFKAIQAGKVRMVTDHIERFTEHGILLKSGEFLDADIIVTATGLELQMLGGMRVEVDGQPMDLSACYTYKGLMLSDVPNLIITFGYLNASWTLRLDLTAEFTCRLMRYMERGQFVQCVPRVSQDELRKPARPFIEGFSSNYLQRALDRMPKQGSGPPWVNPQDYYLDVKLIKRGRFDDGALEFRQGTEDVPKPLSGVDTAGVQAEKVGPVSKTINN